MNEETKDDSQTQPETEDENNKSHLTPDFFYDDLELLEQSPTKSQFDDNYQISYVYGFDLNKRYNAIPVDEDTLLLSAGNFSFFLDISNSREYIINGHDKGVNCIAVHPKGKYVAIGEIGDNPSIYIYQFRNKKLYRILKGGTESAFTALNFSADGTMLASVGTYPDYTLTIWDWEKETLLLRSKAFSQDVFRVTFSETLKGNLTTSGVGHIRFWEMAHTFTGLKLQGEIGKFGNIEISDISGYSMFPDGKVLSGSENGNLLLWQDSIVKCEFRRSNGKSCHNGMIESVFHKGHDIITGGKDGVIRVWDFSTIDTAETDDTTIPVNLTMKSKLRINENASIKCMHMLGNEYLIVDSNSGIYKADLSKKEVTNIQKFHSGSINTISFSPNEPMFVTGGEDGYLRIWDINENKMINEIKFECSITKIYWPSLDIDMNGTTLYVGFKDGCLRVLLIGKNGIILKQPLKPHTKAIRDIAKSPITKMLATTGDDGSVFFFAIESELVPLGFTYINGKKPNTKEEITQAAITGIPIKDDKEYSKGIRIRWSDVVSIECSDGTIASVSPPSLIPNDNNESYYLDIPIEILQNGKIDEDITSFCMRDEGDVIGKKDGCIVFDNYSKKIHSSAITAIAFSNDDIWLVTGSSNGELFLFKRSQIKTRIFTPLNLKDINMELIPKVNDIKKDDYSIEEEKQKSELDKRIQEAEKKKELIKQKIEEKRKEFNSIVEENNKAPNYMKLGLESFKIDPFMYDIQEKKSKELEKDASNSTMWEAEKSRVSLNKVKERLLRNIEEESFKAQSMEKEEDTCPQGCDPALFDKVLDLRESKMDIVDKITAAQTTKEKIKHECDSIQFKRKGLETSFCQIKQEFEEFQHEKQRHLNDLNFSMSLQFHQIQNLESTEVQTPKGTTITKGLPSDLSRSLVFTNSGLKRLQQQEQNLKNDRAACITMMKGNIAKFHEDQKEKEKIRQMIAAQQKKLLDIQQLKFGQSVDLVTLESMKVNPEADKIKETIKEVESKQNDEMNKILNKIEEAKETLNAEIQRNTALLNNLATLTEQQSEIEHVLQSPRRNQTADEFKQDLGLANPDELLSEYVKNDELIDKLNEEIGLLKRR
ncbi:cilia- and flagella-associated protein [Histomonas meleagridis]|uniref:cilia- and flagella-associated protein 44-like n=1 Tax=Histomonas meleagridis TaxID=135588 RepID=UPI00355A4C76|nr:cilia- and flagella-associated protein [Histomonas meleagridis]KAH0801247.1 cilia- and flagella-associated protein 44-like [Histomonas meleagridis]